MENHGLALQPVITYIYLCERLFCILFILFLKPSCNGPETELKCNTGFRETFYNWHYIYGQLVLGPFQQ
jgi:hypothetical protein